jgi:hypothetical protein
VSVSADSASLCGYAFFLTAACAEDIRRETQNTSLRVGNLLRNQRFQRKTVALLLPSKLFEMLGLERWNLPMLPNHLIGSN